MDELKPCPFCGGDAILVNRKNETGVYDVECRTTGCWLQYGADWWVTKNKAISMWNTRAETPIEKAARGVAERLRRLERCPAWLALGLVLENGEGGEMMSDLDKATLSWPGKMTTEQAESFLLTKGFVAAELYDAISKRNSLLEGRVADAINELRNILDELEGEQ